MATKRPTPSAAPAETGGPQKRPKVTSEGSKESQQQGHGQQRGRPQWQQQDRKLEETLSKYLSKILRHDAAKMGIQMRSDGYVLLSDILDVEFFRKNNVTQDDIRRMVENNSKQRFGLAVPEGETELHIRAHQGHSLKSIDDDALLKEIQRPEDLKVLCHGTFQDSLPSIRKQGLKSLSRNHIHCVGIDLTNEEYRQVIINGTRGECDAVIFIDVPAAMKAGVKFYRSSNNVVLTRGLDGRLPAKFFKKVEIWNWDASGWEVTL